MSAIHKMRGSAADVLTTFMASYANTSNVLTYEYTTVNIGAAAANRVVVIGVSTIGSGSRTISSATINGVSATIHLDTVESAETASFISAVVPTGTTNITVSITMNFSCFSQQISVWRLVGDRGNTPTVTTTATDQNSTSGLPIELIATIPAGGVFIGQYMSSDHVTTVTTTNGVEKVNVAVEASSRAVAAFRSVAGANRKLRWTQSGSANRAGSGVVFGP